MGSNTKQIWIERLGLMYRPVPRWLHVLAIVTVIHTTLLLILGAFVTSFHAGMADPVWPTEPWYLYNNYKLDFGYQVEHFHRILGWMLSLPGLVLAFGAWAYEPRKGVRRLGIAATLGMALTFGVFHDVMRRATQGEEGFAVYANIVAMLITMIGVLFAAGQAARGGGTGGLVRALVSIGMIVGMIQGLLGGLRVRLNALVGTDLALIHGVNAQIVFGLLLAVAVLTARSKSEPAMPNAIARKLNWQTLSLVLFTFLQVCWGAWIRHSPGPMANRLHLLFAFVVVGFATLVIKQALADPIARERLKLVSRILMGLITLQVVLGIEAWLGKFLTASLPELEKITVGKAIIRSAHAHIGTWVLGMSVIFALVSRRKPGADVGPPDAPSVDWIETPRYASNGIGTPS